MCLLMVASPNSTPKKKDLECASCNNPHGFGYAVIAGDKIITGRGMSSKKIIKEFLAVRKQYPNGHAMFHARYATHGVKNQENCHPFKVGNSELSYLGHNGILDIKIANGDKRSDSRVFAEDVLPKLGGVSALDDDNVMKMFNKWATGSKIAILTLDPAAKYDCYIINEDAGHWDNEGIWWSNSTYKAIESYAWGNYLGTPSKDYSKYTYAKEVVGDELDYECPKCLTIGYEDANPYYCEVCLTCWECEQVYGDSCLCWSGHEKYKPATQSDLPWGGHLSYGY